MGLFDKIMGVLNSKEVKDVACSIAKDVAGESGRASEAAVAGNASGADIDYGMDYGRDQAYFDDIIDRNFSDYQVKKSVSALDLDAFAHPKCAPVSYLFYKDGTPELAVMLVRKNNYRGRNIIGTNDILKARNIAMLRFFTEMENTEEYVVNRIKSNLL